MNIQLLADKPDIGHAPSSAFVDAMSRTVAGVSVVTTNGPWGRFGLTVSSMVSVSAEPPSLLFCVDSTSPAHDAIRGNGRFGVNVLAAHQRGIANAFAGRGDSGQVYRFDGRTWTDLERLPKLIECSAFFDCALESAMRFGTHTIFLGSVCGATSLDCEPLLYTGRNYGRAASLN
jgi:flavin reductase (DIM6/NTAB) family NADH-FMN oxidoreductase RutF